MSTESKPLPFYQLLDAFEAFTHGEPDVKPQHRSLYYFLLGYARKRGNVPRFALPYEVGMHGSSIGSWATYDAAIKALHRWGFIVYTPGANRYKVPVVELTFRNPSGDELLSYWQSYCLAYPVELQNRNPSPLIELQNQSPTAFVELHNCSSTDNSTANPSGDIKKSLRDKENKTSANAGSESTFSEKPAALDESASAGLGPAAAARPAPPPPTGSPPDPGPTFEAFWQAYGKKEDTKKCKLRWKVLSPAQRRAALAAVPAYVTAKPDRKYRKNPLTWLNGECWLDELPDYAAPPTAKVVPPTGQDAPPISLELEVNPEFEAQQQARLTAEAAARGQKFRAAYATPAPSATLTLTPTS